MVPKVTSDATERAFLEYGVELHRFLTRQVGCGQTARDLAQDVYLRFMLVARQEPIRNAQAFLYQLASHLIYEYRVRRRTDPVVFDSEATDKVDSRSATEMHGDPADGLSASQELYRVLGPLPKMYRVVLLLRKRDGLTPDEIAQKLGFTKKTVYEYLTRAMTKIKELSEERSHGRF